MNAQGRTTRRPTDADYEQLLAVRDGLRRFLHWSETQATEAGLTPAQHQLLLAIRGHGEPPSVGDVAAHLLLKHHSAVELVDRLERRKLVRRDRSQTDRRRTRVRITPRGERILLRLTVRHRAELRRAGPVLRDALHKLTASGR